jgi:hypothetical protein
MSEVGNGLEEEDVEALCMKLDTAAAAISLNSASDWATLTPVIVEVIKPVDF